MAGGWGISCNLQVLYSELSAPSDSKPSQPEIVLDAEHSVNNWFGAISAVILRQWDLLSPGRAESLINTLFAAQDPRC
jgi:hypothetical protein